MSDLILKGVEHVYDAFDEYEHPNPIEVRVSGITLEEAVARGRSLLQEMVDRERKTGGFSSSGTFCAVLTRIEDAAGAVLYEEQPAANGIMMLGT
jgi:hypothetical protein